MKYKVVTKYILVTGDRNAKYGFWWEEIRDALKEHGAEGGFILVHGDAKGIDSIAAHVAKSEFGLDPHEDIKRFPVSPMEWRVFGTKAGPMRNQKMVDFVSGWVARGDEAVCLAFHDNFHQKTGTADCIRRAKAAGIPVHTYFRG